VVNDWINTKRCGEGLRRRDAGRAARSEASPIVAARSIRATMAAALSMFRASLVADAGSTLRINVASNGTATALNVAGTVSANGALSVTNAAGFQPRGGQQWTVIAAASPISGSFTNRLTDYSFSISGNNLNPHPSRRWNAVLHPVRHPHMGWRRTVKMAAGIRAPARPILNTFSPRLGEERDFPKEVRWLVFSEVDFVVPECDAAELFRLRLIKGRRHGAVEERTRHVLSGQAHGAVSVSAGGAELPRRRQVRQQVMATLGRLDVLQAHGPDGCTDALGLRFCEKLAVIDAHAAGETGSG